MSRRSILIIAAVCVSIVSASAIDQASAGFHTHFSGPTANSTVSLYRTQDSGFTTHPHDPSAINGGVPLYRPPGFAVHNPGPGGVPLYRPPGTSQGGQPSKPPTPQQTMHQPMSRVSAGLFPSIEGVAIGSDVTNNCYMVKRRVATAEGEAIRRVRVCETIDPDQNN
jgi:hypothetical protein